MKKIKLLGLLGLLALSGALLHAQSTNTVSTVVEPTPVNMHRIIIPAASVATFISQVQAIDGQTSSVPVGQTMQCGSWYVRADGSLVVTVFYK